MQPSHITQLADVSSQAEARPRVARTAAVNPGPGSFRLLLWLARLGAAGIEPLAYGLGLSQSVVYSHARRLRRAGFVVPVPVNDGGGGAIAVTKLGAGYARVEGIAAIRPQLKAYSSGAHARSVSWIAATVEQHGLKWIGPGVLRQEDRWRLRRFDGAAHLPDLGFIRSDGQPIAVEVELHAKAPERLRTILLAYRDRIQYGPLGGVLYITSRPVVTRLIHRTAAKHTVGLNYLVEPLETYVEGGRRRMQPGSRA